MPMQEVDFSFIIEPIPRDKYPLLTREEAIRLLELQTQITEQIAKENRELRKLNEVVAKQRLLIDEQFVTLKSKFFGRSSERSPTKKDDEKPRGAREKKVQVRLPSERYPNAPIIITEVELETLPNCQCCGDTMKDSGMVEESEFLSVIPKKYQVIRQRRHKYKCTNCQADIKTAPLLPRIKPGSSYSDDMIIDIAMSKYCDLIPVERYATMAAREGFKGLPPQSLIEATHNLAEYVKPAYSRLMDKILSSPILNADETTHRMLEGDQSSRWYLWGFSTPSVCLFEAHNTRSGDVASAILKQSICEYLVSDVFSGYNKSVKVTNLFRQERNLVPLKNVFCNAHSRRKFKYASEFYPEEGEYFIVQYQEIYKIEDEIKGKPPDEILSGRQRAKVIFEEMQARAIGAIAKYSAKSSIVVAFNYFLKNYDGLTRYLEHPGLPVDNNSQERLLRNPVIGRKTWLGTHSKRGAETAVVLFSLVESCKLNGVNPREYFKQLVEHLHCKKPVFTPDEYKDVKSI